MTAPGPEGAARRNLDDFTRRAKAFDRKILEEETARFDEAVRGAGIAPGSVAVDFGIGTGNSALPFLHAGGRVIGIDLTPAMAEKGAKRLADQGFGGNALLVIAPAERAPLAEGAADAAVCRNVFHHFENPRAVLGEMARIVRPGGHVFVLDFYDPEGEEEREIINRVEYLRVSSHVRNLSMSEHRAMFSEAGLRLGEPMTFSAPTRFKEWMADTGASPENLAAIRSEMEKLRDSGGGWWEVESEGDDFFFQRKRAILVGEKS